MATPAHKIKRTAVRITQDSIAPRLGDQYAEVLACVTSILELGGTQNAAKNAARRLTMEIAKPSLTTGAFFEKCLEDLRNGS